MFASILPYIFMLVLAIEGAIAVSRQDPAMVFVIIATFIVGVTAYKCGPDIYMRIRILARMTTKHAAHADIPASETSTIADASAPAPTEDAPEKTQAALLSSPLLASDSFRDFAFAPRVPSPDPKIHYAIKHSPPTSPQPQPALTAPEPEPAAIEALSGPIHRLSGHCSLLVANLAASSAWAPAKAQQQQPILPTHVA